MSPASEFMAEVSLAHSYPELDVWQRYKPDSSKGFGTLNPGFPFSPLQCRHAGLGWGGGRCPRNHLQGPESDSGR